MIRFLFPVLLAITVAVPCVGQTIFDAHTISGAQNDYITTHAIDPLGNRYLNIYTNGGNPVSVYGKDYDLGYGDYIFRFDATDSLTLIYSLESDGVVQDFVQAMSADKDGNLYVASQYYDGYGNVFRYTKYGPDGKKLWRVEEDIDTDMESKKVLVDAEGKS